MQMIQFHASRTWRQGRLGLTLVLLGLMACTTVYGQERYRLSPDERVAINEAARTVWSETRIERVTAQLIEDEPVARVEFIAHSGDALAADFYVAQCKPGAAENTWACGETETWRHIVVGDNQDTIQVAPGLDLPSAFEIARFVRQLHLLESEAMENESLVNGAITSEQLYDQVMIEPVDNTYRVSLKGLPLRHNFVIVQRKPCGRFATCGLEYLSNGSAAYTALPPTKRAPVPPRY